MEGNNLHIESVLADYNVEMRNYQIETVKENVEWLLRSDTESILDESATGSGKTIMALMTLACIHIVHPEWKIGWTVMRKNLLKQAAKENIERGFNLPIQFFSMFDDNPPECDILVVDEAHHDATESMARIHAKSKPKKVLGLTATPKRSDKAELAFEKVVCKAGMWQLVREGYLAQVEHYSIPSWEVERVCYTYVQNKARFGKTVIFLTTNEQCIEAQKLLAGAGVRATVVTGQTDRNRQIDEFEDGKWEVLVNMQILTEGFDCPSLETVFVRDTVEGLTAQMCGRVLRQFEGLQKKIVQSKETLNPFTKFAPVKCQFIAEPGCKTWLSLTPNKELIAETALATMGATLESGEDDESLTALSLMNRRAAQSNNFNKRRKR